MDNYSIFAVAELMYELSRRKDAKVIRKVGILFFHP